ncbi:glycoside hydrolase family 5 protein [Spirochaeta dissipatitropha]
MKFRHTGFNVQWMYSYPEPALEPDFRMLDFAAANRFSFIRVPVNYWYLNHDFSYFPLDLLALEKIDRYISAITERGMHASLNLHRAPGYCINGAEMEAHNLWTDAPARTAFIAYWKFLAERYSSYTSEQLSFDLLNEPPRIGQYNMSLESHNSLIAETIQTIKQVSPDRIIVVDGLSGGNIPIPELIQPGVIQSGRAYQPMRLTHYNASWCEETHGMKIQDYPGTEYDGKIWTIETIRDHFRPWENLENMGSSVHIGELGCYNTVPNSSALRWFEDLFTVLRQNNWGWAFWNFDGPFGICEHGRSGARYTRINGYNIDADLWQIVKNSISA